MKHRLERLTTCEGAWFWLALLVIAALTLPNLI